MARRRLRLASGCEVGGADVVALPDVVEFLERYPPFAELGASDLEALATSVEIEFHPSGAVIFAKGEDTVEFLRVIRAGSVEVRKNDEILDVMGPGEMFGHASMLSGLPTGFEARVAEDTLTYRIPAEVAGRFLGRPQGLRYVTRLLLEDRHHLRSGTPATPSPDRLREPVRTAMRTAPLVCAPSATIREAAQSMSDANASAIIVNLGDALGIVTDSDLRTRVVARGLSGDSAVASVMTAPAITVTGERPGSDVLLDMIDRGFRHFPVTSATGQLIGIVEDHDLVSLESHSSYFLRLAIADAQTPDELVAAATSLRPAIVSLRRSGLSALDVMSVYSVAADALTRRALDFATAHLGDQAPALTWLALGSQARREALPSSDLDSAVSFADADGAAELDAQRVCARIASDVSEVLFRCGLRPDEHRASASDQLFVRSLSSWQRAARSLLEDPAQEKALVIISVLADSRPVWGASGPFLADVLGLARVRPRFLRLLAEFALLNRPPVGFFRGLVVLHSGERSHLDLKTGAVAPITNLARWAGMTAGVTAGSTLERLGAGGDAGTLAGDDARILCDAFELVCQVRLDHQVHALQAGSAPNDVIDLAEISPLTRAYLKDAFRAVAGVQRRVAADLEWGA